VSEAIVPFEAGDIDETSFIHQNDAVIKKKKKKYTKYEVV